MRSRSARFDAVIRQSHQMSSTVDVLYNRQVVAEGLAVLSGEVTLDRRAAVMGRCSVEFAEPALLPTVTDGGRLSPYGYELQVRRGIVYSDGASELLPLGVFPIQISRFAGATLLTSVTAMDRAQQVRDARLEDDYAIASGTNYATAIQSLIEAGVPDLTFAFQSTSFTTPSLVFAAQTDRWEAAQQMAKAIGCELFFDGVGTCTLRTEPSLSTRSSVWTFNEGADGVLLDVDLTLDRGPAYNKVIASGQNTGATAVYRGGAVDDDPSSPTYYDGPFGHKPRFYASPLLASDAQCSAAAASLLASSRGVARALDISVVPHPGIEPGDPVTITRANLGLDEIHLVDAVTIGLAATDTMTIASRLQQAAA